MLKSRQFILSTFILVASGATYAAATAPAPAIMPVKIGVVDMQQLMQQAPAVASIKKKLQAQFDPQQQKLNARGKDIQAEAANLNKNGPTMSSDARLKLKDKIMAEQDKLGADFQALQQASGLAQQQAMHTLMSQLQAAVNKVAKENNDTLVIPSAGGSVLYAAPETDITKQVLANMPKS